MSKILDNIRKMLDIYIDPRYKSLVREYKSLNRKRQVVRGERESLVGECLGKNDSKVELLNAKISEIDAQLDIITDKRDSLIITLLNEFPINVPCTSEHISKSIHIPHTMMYFMLTHWYPPARNDNKLLSNWRHIRKYGNDYYERFE